MVLWENQTWLNLLMTFITTLEKALSRGLGREVEFKRIFEPLKLGDLPVTYTLTDKLQEAVGFKPSTTIQEGLQNFAEGYVRYYALK